MNRGGCSYGERMGCAYRGNNGKKCAAGLLIPDEKYEPEFETCGCYLTPRTSGGKRDNTLKIQIILEEQGYDPKIIQQFQILHDNVSGFSINAEKQVLKFKELKKIFTEKLNEGIPIVDIFDAFDMLSLYLLEDCSIL